MGVGGEESLSATCMMGSIEGAVLSSPCPPQRGCFPEVEGLPEATQPPSPAPTGLLATWLSSLPPGPAALLEKAPSSPEQR